MNDHNTLPRWPHRATGYQPGGEPTEDAKVLADLAMTCAHACVAGWPTVHITTRGKRPAGFPRGELLSVGTDGSRNYACNPVKVLAWLHSRTCKTPNTEGKRA